MCVLKRIVPVALVAVLVLNANNFAFAGQDTDQGLLQENRKQLMKTNSCPGCDLSGVNLDRMNLTGANLEGANLSKVRLHLATLAQANLRNTDLRGAELGGADLAEADLRGADLRGATFAGAYLSGVKLDNEVTLNQSSNEFVSENLPVQNIVTENAVSTPSQEPGFFDNTLESLKGLFGLGGPDEDKVVTEKTDKSGSSDEVTREAAPVVQPLAEKDLVAADIAPAREETKAETAGGEIAHPSEEPGFFDNTVDSVKGLFGQGKNVGHETVTEKTDSVVQGEIQSQENQTAGAVDPAAEVEKNIARLVDTNRCYGCSLVGVDLTGKNLDGVDLESADLTGSSLEGADLENANLKGALMVRVNLKNADLRGADLYKANLSGADLTGAKLDGAFLDDAQLSDVVGYEPKEEK